MHCVISHEGPYFLYGLDDRNFQEEAIQKRKRYKSWENSDSSRIAGRLVELVMLHDKNADLIAKMGRASKNAMLVFKYVESNPIIEIQKTSEALGIAYNTTSSAVNRLVNIGILTQTTNANRNRTFAYEEYLAVLRKGT